MNFKISQKNIIPFIAFFLITIGNGDYVGTHFGNLIEYLGLILLVALSLASSFRIKKRINNYFKILFFSGLLSIGSFIQNDRFNIFVMVFSTSFIIMCFVFSSGKIIASNCRIKVLANSIMLGAIVTALIGIITGTLGLSFGTNESIIGILYLSGFSIKNYCGGIWLLLFILYYVYYFRAKLLKRINSLLFLAFLGFLLILSGSKGACLLCFIFLVMVNSRKIIIIGKKYKKIASIAFLISAIGIGIYIYSNILIRVDTYAYRMRGLQKLVSYMCTDMRKILFGVSDIAYANTGFNYTYNMRNFLGWEASVEMAYVNVLIKNGMLGIVCYTYVFIYLFKSCSNDCRDRQIIISLLMVMLISGFVETYIVSVHYVVGPVLYCFIAGLLQQNWN